MIHMNHMIFHDQVTVKSIHKLNHTYNLIYEK
jgi:hypothetical protein